PIKTVTVDQPGQSNQQLAIDMELPVDRGIWIAARCDAGPTQVAHTTPIYVTVNGGSFRNPKTAPKYLDQCEQYLSELEKEIAQPSQQVAMQAWRYRQGLEQRIAETRKIIAKLRAEQ